MSCLSCLCRVPVYDVLHTIALKHALKTVIAQALSENAHLVCCTCSQMLSADCTLLNVVLHVTPLPLYCCLLPLSLLLLLLLLLLPVSILAALAEIHLLLSLQDRM